MQDRRVGPRAEATKEGTAQRGLPLEYRRWNRVLADFFLLQAEPNQDVFLSVTPSSLSRALDEVEGEPLSPDDSQRDFKRAVATMYSQYVVSQGHGIGALSSEDEDGIPQSVAFLGVSVLAAYDQERDPERDEQFGKLRYYRPLSDALGCRLMSNNLPEGFDPDEFDQLWNDLAYWVLDKLQAVLDLPRSDRGHVAYPHRHVLLRQVDIDKLPVMFEREGFEPWSRSVSPNRMGGALDRYSSLTGNARTALGDKRRQAVIEQALDVLNEWDGSVDTGVGIRKAAIRLHLWFQRGDVPVLSYLPSRPAGFPDSFETSNGIALEGEDGPYYSSILITASDGNALVDGFEWKTRGFTLRRPPCRVVALSQSSDPSGFLSEPGLHRERTSAVLCVGEMLAGVTAHLDAITGRQNQPTSGGELPDGWSLFRNVTPKTMVDPPVGLEALAVSETVSIDFVGGIRLERGRTWLAGSIPKIYVTPSDAAVKVDGGALSPVIDGEVSSESMMAVGSHLITVGRLTRRMNVREAAISEGCTPLIADLGEEHVMAVVPRGEWTLLGAHPTELLRVECTRNSGIFATGFNAVWAVDARNGGGKRPIMCLVYDPPPPLDASPAPECRAWCDAIRRAQQHRAGFVRLGDARAPVRDPQPAWGRYVALSKRLRRHCGRMR